MYIYMCTINRQNDHTNTVLRIDGKSGVSHDICTLYPYNWPRCKKTFCQVALILLKRTRSTAKAIYMYMQDNRTVPGQASQNLIIGVLCIFLARKRWFCPDMP